MVARTSPRRLMRPMGSRPLSPSYVCAALSCSFAGLVLFHGMLCSGDDDSIDNEIGNEGFDLLLEMFMYGSIRT